MTSYQYQGSFQSIEQHDGVIWASVNHNLDLPSNSQPGLIPETPRCSGSKNCPLKEYCVSKKGDTTAHLEVNPLTLPDLDIQVYSDCGIPLAAFIHTVNLALSGVLTNIPFIGTILFKPSQP